MSKNKQIAGVEKVLISIDSLSELIFAASQAQEHCGLDADETLANAIEEAESLLWEHVTSDNG